VPRDKLVGAIKGHIRDIQESRAWHINNGQWGPGDLSLQPRWAGDPEFPVQPEPERQPEPPPRWEPPKEDEEDRLRRMEGIPPARAALLS
jgi:hypothetical protein